MKISLHTFSVQIYTKHARQPLGILEKGLAHATARKFEPAVLVNARLAPTCCRCRARCRSLATWQRIRPRASRDSSHPVSRNNEQTFEELLARVARTIDYLKGVPASALEGSEDRDIKVPARDRTLQFKGLEFSATFCAAQLLLPRHDGVRHPAA